MPGMAMSAADAKAQVELFTSASEDPVLSSGDLDTLVANAKTIDAEGRAPTDADWVETYDVYAAVAAGWRVKAGKAAGRYTFQTGQMRENESDLHKHCLAMAEYYGRFVMGTSVVRGQVGRYEDEADEIGVDIP